MLRDKSGRSHWKIGSAFAAPLPLMKKGAVEAEQPQIISPRLRSVLVCSPNGHPI